MARTIDWNKKAVKLLSKFVPAERYDNWSWYNDKETETEYILSWDNEEGIKQSMVVNKKTNKVTFVN
jgi:hypothetical protein